MIQLKVRYYAQRLLRSELLRNASVLFTGTVAAQLISILLQPFLRRFFSAEAFGVFSVYMSLVGILSVLCTFKYEDAIVLPRKDKESVNILALSLIINVSFNLFILLLLVLFGRQIASVLNLPEGFSIWLLCLIPVSACLYSIYQSFNNWLIRKKGFTDITVNKIIRRGSEGLAQVSFALIKYAKGLIISDIVGQVMNNISSVRRSIKHGFSLRQVSKNKIRYVAKKYSDFPTYNLIPSFMSTCSFLLPAVLINKFYSSEYAGYFDLSKLLLSIPLALVASSFSGVLLQQVAEKVKSRKSFLNDLKPVLLIVCTISILEIVAILLFGTELFRFVFGPGWGISGDISKILVWSFAFNFFISSFSSIFISMRRIKTYGIRQFVYFIAIISLVLFKHLLFNDFLKTYVLLEIGCYSIITIVMLLMIIKYEMSLRSESHHNGAFLN